MRFRSTTQTVVVVAHPLLVLLLASSRVVVTLTAAEFGLPLDCFVVVKTEKVELCVPVPALATEEESTNGGDRSPPSIGDRVEGFVVMLVRWFAEQYNDLSWIVFGREIEPASSDPRSHVEFVLQNLDAIIPMILAELAGVYGSWYDPNSYAAYDWIPVLYAAGLSLDGISALEEDYRILHI